MNSFEQNTQQTNEYIQVHTKLSDIYAGIEGELCSKQSTLMNKLKNQFTNLYSDLLPSHYVIVNHVLSLSDLAFSNNQTRQKIQMATENGVILLVKPTYLGQKIFINGLCDQQLIFEAKGTLQAKDLHLSKENLTMAQNIQETILLANDSLALNKLYGATILVYSTISSTTSFYKQKIQLAVFLATIVANQQLNQLSLDEIYEKLYHSHIFTPQFLEAQFAPFKQGQLLMTHSFQDHKTQNEEIRMESFKIPQKEKLLFFNLDLSKEKLENIKKINDSINHLINKTQQSNAQQFQQFVLTITDQLQHGHVCLSEYIKQINKQKQLNQNLKEVLEEIQKQTKEQINQVLKQVGKEQAEYILSQGHMIFCVKPHEIHEKIRLLRKFINGQLNQNPEIITNRFNGAKGVDKIIFSSSPSLAISIFNPEHQVWFK